MFTAVSHKNLADAESYFDEHLAQNDYYAAGEIRPGQWIGAGAERLGLNNVVTREQFHALCENRNPNDDERLTQRQQKENQRRVFFDFTCAPPKSVSVLAVTMDDQRLVTAHEESARIAFRELETFAATRVRKQDNQRDRTTGNLVAAAFVHNSSRELDPQLHTHFTVFNATFDETERCWKALQAGGMYDAIRYGTAVYRNELAKRVQQIGYRIQPAKYGFEIEGVNPEVLNRFSKRARQRDQAVQKMEQNLGRKLTNDEISHVVHQSRAKKLKGISTAEVRERQLAQLQHDELQALQKLLASVQRIGQQRIAGLENQTLNQTIAHLFERKSVVPEHELLNVALAQRLGDVDLPTLKAAVKYSSELVKTERGFSTKKILATELDLIQTVNTGCDAVAPLHPGYRLADWLGEDQKRAIFHVLRTSDRITGLRGLAGTGKTTALRELVVACKEASIEPVFCAPTAAATDVLCKEGFEAMTLQSLLLTKPALSARQLVVLDEAGAVGIDDMRRLLSTALANSGGTNLDAESYAYNQASQRIGETNTAGDYRNYTYDNMGELTTAIGKEAGGVTNRWQEQLGYAYDAAGNLIFRTNNALLQEFNVNSLNELTTITNGGRLTVAGTTTSAATNVTVNTSNAVLYADVTFASTNQPWSSGNNTFKAIAHDVYGRWSTNTETVNLPATNSYTYDLNGNLLYDGNRAFAYDDENELIQVTVTNNWQEQFTYDGKMRRRIEKDYSWNGSSWLQTNEIHFIYDGNMVVQERNVNNLPTVTYTRGNDLSGKLQSAGGIGGLLARTDNSQLMIGSSSAHAFYHADGNGNVTCLIYTNQTIAAKYLYDPYGNTLSAYGALANANSYRFSSKEWNANSGLYYYLYRFYDPNLQRWPNRDPLGDAGSLLYASLNRHHYFNRLFDIIQQKDGINLYEMIQNSPANLVDRFGLSVEGFCAHLEEQIEAAEANLFSGPFGTYNPQVGAQLGMLQGLYDTYNCDDDNDGGNTPPIVFNPCPSVPGPFKPGPQPKPKPVPVMPIVPMPKPAPIRFPIPEPIPIEL